MNIKQVIKCFFGIHVINLMDTIRIREDHEKCVARLWVNCEKCGRFVCKQPIIIDVVKFQKNEINI